MPGPRPKPDAQRQRRNMPKKPATGTAIIPASAAEIVPDPSPDWSDTVAADWQALWSHPILAAMDTALHEPTLRRLFDRRDEYRKLFAICMAAPLVEGSMGQSRANPLYSRLSAVESQLIALEDRTGLNPKAMADLGISFAGAVKSLDELAEGSNAQVLEDEADPRIVDAEVID